MRIQKLIIKGLYGYLDKSIDFNGDINLLVGINGSGKTTILNVINWLIRPSLGHLAVHLYEKLNLTFIWKEKEYEIEAVQTESDMLLSIKNITENKSYNKINVKFKIHPSKLVNSDTARENLIMDYTNLRAEKHEIDSWKLVFETLPNPIVVGLDRNLFIEEDNYHLIEDNLQKKLLLEKNINPGNSPLDKVKDLTQKRYSYYKSRLIDLNARLNDKIMLSSFDEPFTENTFSELRKQANITPEQVENLHKKVKDYFEENISKRKGFQKHMKELSLDKVEKYFIYLKKVISDAKKDKDKEQNFFYLANISHFKKLKGLIAEFEDFETKSNKYYEPLREFLDILNKFYADSSKRLFFDKETAELKFNVLTKDGEAMKSERDIKSLSSGEKQLLILFTYLKFNNPEERIFIIDEPEISLHPKWQKDFLPAVEKLAKGHSQLIIATHSPNIVGKKKEYCKVLLPYNE